MRVREIGSDAAEIRLVAERMRLTLIEVLGEERGGGMYTPDWLIDRLKFHLDPAQCTGAVLLAETEQGQIIAHTIVRIEPDPTGNIGLFSTFYVSPEFRKQRIAS